MALTAGVVLGGLQPAFRAAVSEWLMPWCAYLNLEGRIVSGYRSNEEQDRLFRLGRSPYEYQNAVRLRGARGSVTDAPPGSSAHNYGLAIDVEGPDQAAIVEVGRQLGFGTVSWDPAHLEWPNFSQLLREALSQR